MFTESCTVLYCTLYAKHRLHVWCALRIVPTLYPCIVRTLGQEISDQGALVKNVRVGAFRNAEYALVRGAECDQRAHARRGGGAQLRHAPQQEAALGHAHRVVAGLQGGVSLDDGAPVLHLHSAHDTRSAEVTRGQGIRDSYRDETLAKIRKSVSIAIFK